MKKVPNNKMIAIFTIASIAIMIAIILGFLGDKIIKRNDNIILMYFEGSVQGLSVGSNVSFRGVEIGKVIRIDIVGDNNDLNFGIPVYAKLNSNQGFKDKGLVDVKDKEKFIQDLIEKGLRARINTQSFLTGQSMIELELLPNSPAIFRAEKILPKGMTEIPTVMSPLAELSKGLQDLPIRQILKRFNVLLEVFNQKAPIILDQTADFTVNMNKLSIKASKVADQALIFSTTLNKHSPEMIKNAADISNLINKAFNDNVDKISITLDNLNKTIVDMGNAAQAMKELADYLERHPDALLKGKKE